jgi:hypothetical protein
MKRFVLVSAVIGFFVPFWWGVLANFVLTGRQSPATVMFLRKLQMISPVCRLQVTVIRGGFATPFLNAVLYGGVAGAIAIVVRGLNAGQRWPLRLDARVKTAIVVCGAPGWMFAVVPLLTTGRRVQREREAACATPILPARAPRFA